MNIYEIVSDVLAVVGIAVVVGSVISLNRKTHRYKNQILLKLIKTLKESEKEVNRIINCTYHDMELKADFLKELAFKLREDLDHVNDRVGVHEERLNNIEDKIEANQQIMTVLNEAVNVLELKNRHKL